MEPNHDGLFGMTLHQQVVNLLTLRPGQWCCDRCLTLALDRRDQHAVEYVTDALAASGSYSRSRGVCGDCRRFKVVTMASSPRGSSQRGAVRFLYAARPVAPPG